jgi:hypothetical protein
MINIEVERGSLRPRDGVTVSTTYRHRDDLAVSVKTKPTTLVLIGSDRYILNESDASHE